MEKKKDINVKVLKDIKTLFESDEEDYYKPIRTGNIFSSNYIEYQSNGNKDKTLFIDDYIDKTERYLNDLIDNHKTKGEWKIQLTMAINFISSKDSDETRTMHTKSDNIKIIIKLLKNFLILFYKDIKKN